MTDFIYDEQGACVARIVSGDVFSEAHKRRIATVSNGKIFAFALACTAMMSLPIDGARAAGGFKVLYSFTGGNDGEEPVAGVIKGKHGYLYGATAASNAGGPPGTVFELARGGALTELNFCGYGPEGTPVSDKKGNLYGTGVSDGGEVFKIATDGTCTVLHYFTGTPDGDYPLDGLILDSKGNLYGTTSGGGTSSCNPAPGCGTVFEISPPARGQTNWTEKVLYSFTGSPDGSYPVAGLTMDASGNLYGTTYEGGNYGYGTVFKLASGGSETVLYSFCQKTNGDWCEDGAAPYGGVILDSAGNLYGTASSGGEYGYGIVFQLAPNGTQTLLHSFDLTDGADPMAGLTWGQHGNLYGTAMQGGDPNDDAGTVFQITNGGTFTILHSFSGNDGELPSAALFADTAGNLYGTTQNGGPDNAGVVFKLKE